MKTLVLGGSVFVGKHTVEALLADGHEVAVLNRGRTPTDLPDDVERLVADRTDTDQLRSALDGRDWDAVFDVSGFVMAAGGSDIEGLLDLLDGHVGHYVYVSSIMAYDQSLGGIFPWTEDLPTNPDGAGSYGGFKAVAEAGDARPPRGDRFPGDDRPPGGDLRAGQQHLRHGAADVPAPARPPADPGPARRAGRRPRTATSTTSARRWCRWSATRPPLGEVFNITGESVSVNRYIEVLADVVGEKPDVVYVPDSMLGELPSPVFGHLFGVRHHAMASIEKAQQLLGFTCRYDLRSGHEHTYEWFRPRGTPTSTDRWSTRCGRRRGTSTPRPRSPSRCAVAEPSDAEMWRSVEATVRDVLLPSIADDWARVMAMQLVGMARFAATRPRRPDCRRGWPSWPTVLDRLAPTPSSRRTGRCRRQRPEEVLAATGAVLAGAVARDDAAGDEVRAALRPVVSRHLDEDLAVTGMLMPYFRGPAPRCVTSWRGGSASSPGRPVGVADLRRITTGHSRGQLVPRARRRVALRRAGRAGRRVRDVRAPTSSSSCRRSGGSASPWPACAGWSRPARVIGQPFFVMDFIEGGVATEREDRSLAPELAVDFVRRLDELHHLEWEGVLDGPPPSEATHVQIERWADVYRSTSPRAGAAARGGGRVAARQRAAARARGARPRRPGTRKLRPRRPAGAGVHRLGVLPPRRPDRGLVVPPVDAWGEDDAGRGVAGPDPARGRGRGGRDALRYWRAFNFFKGACANRSCLQSFAGSTRRPTWRSSARCCSRRSCARWPTSSPSAVSRGSKDRREPFEQARGRRAGGAARQIISAPASR